MAPSNKEDTEEPANGPDDRQDSLRKFIEQKKLQNRILGKIIDKIINAEHSDKSQKTNKNKKS